MQSGAGISGNEKGDGWQWRELEFLECDSDAQVRMVQESPGQDDE